jgi:hypothetical protein
MSKFSDIRAINKTHNKFLVHELKMRFKFRGQAILMLLKNIPHPLLWKIYLYEKCFLFLHYRFPNNLYYQKFHEMERICEIESGFKIVYFFIHPV